jgi:YggT family protein
MGISPVQASLIFVVQVLFGLYILLVVLRFLLQWVKADFYNPFSQVIMKATQPVLRPVRRYVPSVAGLDTSSLLLMLVLQLVELWLIALIIGIPAGFGGLLILAIGRLLELVIYVFMGAIIVLVILSWVQPRSYNPVMGLLNSLSAPIMRPARQIVPVIGGLDLSPIAAFLVLGIVLRLVVYPLQYGSGLAPPL